MAEKNSRQTTTKEKILQASLKLFSENGYKGATLKKIALEAGVTEMTVFRIFETKEKIYEEIMSTFSSAAPLIRAYLEKEATYDLETDLKNIAHIFYNQMLDNAHIIMIIFKEKDIKSVITEKSLLELKYLFVLYFEKMKEKGKMIDVNSDTITFAFLTSTIGTFMTRQRFPGIPFTPQEELIDTMIPVFARGLSVEQ
ncbi:TetR/AcrR family transcriptional regulator [Chengkuizengella axinellae]|uniref:TetR/AcrR family transcriptional regulator n=1 Tax=Chengkuizengella axinellae TaxID=3064388 RepID=A0ABT9J3H8_9BACL|nr:TetR/AcrR family transcriptional regulator [Chengkuizengella sp. 2205SS18-9]MDP5275549.1 TetR/AcrR family transcriptional regulator [Chengkuizengella sp. 2205SS18-9]